jgi:hypothetical protein
MGSGDFTADASIARNPTFVGSTSASQTTAGTGPLAIDVPSGVADGDLLLLYVGTASGGGPNTVTPPSGWTTIFEWSVQPGVFLYGRIASSEPSSYEVSVGTSAEFNLIMHATRPSTGSWSSVLDAVHTVEYCGSPTTPHLVPEMRFYGNATVQLHYFSGIGRGSTNSTKSASYTLTQNPDSGGTTASAIESLAQYKDVAVGTAPADSWTTSNGAGARSIQVAVVDPSAVMPPTVRGFAIKPNTASNVTSTDVPTPPAYRSGDLLMMVINTDGGATVTTPTGWELAESSAYTDNGYVYTRVADGTEGSAVTVSTSSTLVNAGMLAVSGMAGGVLAHDSQQTAASSTVTVPALTVAAQSPCGFVLDVAINCRGDSNSNITAVPSGDLGLGYTSTSYAPFIVVKNGSIAGRPAFGWSGRFIDTANPSSGTFTISGAIDNIGIVVEVGQPPPARLSQLPVEVLVEPDNAAARLSQLAVEVLVENNPTVSDSFTADAIIAATAADTFTADALIRRTTSDSFTADAVIFATLEHTFTADAVKSLGTKIKTFTADAIIEVPWGPWSETEGNDLHFEFTADARIVYSTTDTFTADALVSAAISDSFTADAIIARTISDSLTVDAAITTAVTDSFTANAVILSTIGGSFSADAVKYSAVGTHAFDFTADAAIWSTGTVTDSFTADANIFATVEQTFAADAIVTQPRSGSLTADAVIGLTRFRFVNANAVIAASSGTKTFTADAVKGHRYFTADAAIFANSGTKTFTIDASFVAKSFTADAAIAGSSGTKTFTADAYILQGVFWADARIVLPSGAHTFTVDATISIAATLSASWTIAESASSLLPITWEVGETGISLPISWSINYNITDDLAASWAIDEQTGPPDPDVLTTSIQVNGVDITEDVDILKSTFEMAAGPNPGQAKVYVLDRGHTMTFPVGARLTLDIGELRVWGGYVMGVRRNYAFPAQDTTTPGLVPRYWVLEGSDYNILFQKRYVWNKANPTEGIDAYPEGVRDDDVINDLVTDYLNMSDEVLNKNRVYHVGTPVEDADGSPLVAGISFGEAMKNIALMPGAIFYFDADRILNYADVDVVDAPFKLSDQPDNVEFFGYRDLEIEEDGTNLANDALVWGAALGVDTMSFGRYENAASQAEHGLWQWADFRKDLYRQKSVNKRAQTYVEGSTQNNRGHKDDAITIRCTVFKPGLRAGMKVRFRSNVHGYNDVIPIRSMRIKFVNRNEASYELTLAHYLDEAWNTAEFKNPPEGSEGECIPITYCEDVSVGDLTDCMFDNFNRTTAGGLDISTDGHQWYEWNAPAGTSSYVSGGNARFDWGAWFNPGNVAYRTGNYVAGPWNTESSWTMTMRIKWTRMATVGYGDGSPSAYARIRFLGGDDTSSSPGVMLTWTSNATYLPTLLVSEDMVSGPYQSAYTSVSPGIYYIVKCQYTGSVIRARVWADGGSEPSTWAVTDSIPTGFSMANKLLELTVDYKDNPDGGPVERDVYIDYINFDYDGKECDQDTYTLASSYIEGTVSATNKDGDQVDVEEVNPGAGTISVPSSATSSSIRVCYQTCDENTTVCNEVESGCTDEVCGITDTFTRTAVHEWGTSDAGLPWTTYYGVADGDYVIEDGIAKLQIGDFQGSQGFNWAELPFPVASFDPDFTSTMRVQWKDPVLPEAGVGDVFWEIDSKWEYPGPKKWRLSVELSRYLDSTKLRLFACYDLYADRVQASIDWEPTPDTWYQVKVEHVYGSSLSLKIWEEGTNEPGAWTLSIDTSSLNKIDPLPLNGSSNYWWYVQGWGLNDGTHREFWIDDLDIPGINRCSAVQFDDFDRTVASGWGTASGGTAWTKTAGAASASVDGSSGVITSSINNESATMTWNDGGTGEQAWWTGSAPRSHSYRMRFKFNFAVPGIGAGYVRLAVMPGSLWAPLINISSVQGNYGFTGVTVSKLDWVSGTYYIADFTYDASTGNATFVVYEEGSSPGTVSTQDISSSPPLNAEMEVFYGNATGSGTARPIYIDYIDFDYDGKPCYPYATIYNDGSAYCPVLDDFNRADSTNLGYYNDGPTWSPGGYDQSAGWQAPHVAPEPAIYSNMLVIPMAAHTYSSGYQYAHIMSTDVSDTPPWRTDGGFTWYARFSPYGGAGLPNLTYTYFAIFSGISDPNPPTGNDGNGSIVKIDAANNLITMTGDAWSHQIGFDVVPGAFYMLAWEYIPGVSSKVKIYTDGSAEPDAWHIETTTATVASSVANICFGAWCSSASASSNASTAALDWMDFDYQGKPPCYEGGQTGIVCYDDPSAFTGVVQDGEYYRPAHVRQLGWGTSFDGLNCTMASACIALDRHTLGAKTATPPEMRAAQLDQSGGTDLNDADYAWNHGWNENLNVQYGVSWNTFMSMINNGRGAIVQGYYSQVPSYLKAQQNFNGGHAVYVNEFSSTGNALVYDPLAKSARWWPASVVRDYAEAFGGGNVSAGFTQITG